MKKQLLTALLATTTAMCLCSMGTVAGAQELVDPEKMPGPLREVRFDQNLGTELPLGASFVDEEGRDVKLGDFFGARPVVLAFVYYECPMLCTLTLSGLTSALGVVDLAIGEEIDVVVISVDPGEGPAQARQVKGDTLLRYGHPESTGHSENAAGWHFLTGAEEQIAAVTRSAGFSYVYLPEEDEYAHTSGIVIATPQGVISQYFLGIEYPPKDMRLALVESSSGQIGSVVDQLLLYCFRFDPKSGKYTAATLNILRLAAALTTLALFGYIGLTWRRERIRSRAHKPSFGAA